jgi:hypothetical protein
MKTKKPMLDFFEHGILSADVERVLYMKRAPMPKPPASLSLPRTIGAVNASRTLHCVGAKDSAEQRCARFI